MKNYQKAREQQSNRRVQLIILNETAEARRAAMSTHSNQYSKEIYRHYLEISRETRLKNK